VSTVESVTDLGVTYCNRLKFSTLSYYLRLFVLLLDQFLNIPRLFGIQCISMILIKSRVFKDVFLKGSVVFTVCLMRAS